MTFVWSKTHLEFSYEVCEGQYTPPFSVFERTVSILPVLTVLVHHPKPVSVIQAQTKGVTIFVFFLPSFPILATSTCISDLHRVFISTTANAVHINIISGDLQTSLLFYSPRCWFPYHLLFTQGPGMTLYTRLVQVPPLLKFL